MKPAINSYFSRSALPIVACIFLGAILLGFAIAGNVTTPSPLMPYHAQLSERAPR